jgi:hypothetical protein
VLAVREVADVSASYETGVDIWQIARLADGRSRAGYVCRAGRAELYLAKPDHVLPDGADIVELSAVMR